MKIEKLNENQIRCTLTHADLAARHLKLSELAYGTEKAKSLFRDMMQQASFDFGFEAENIPLMIEAIPLSQDTIILVITKVEYPEELDTRFSRFSDPDSEDVYEEAMAGGGAAPAPEGADDILGLFRRIQEERRKAADAQGSKDSFVSEENDKKKGLTFYTSILFVLSSDRCQLLESILQYNHLTMFHQIVFCSGRIL